MKLEQTIVFNFSFIAEGIGFNFSIPAHGEDEACQKLTSALAFIQDDLKQAIAKKRVN